MQPIDQTLYIPAYTFKIEAEALKIPFPPSLAPKDQPFKLGSEKQPTSF